MEQPVSGRTFEHEPEYVEAAEETSPLHSLTDDVRALFEDGKTYAQAELAYQKSRGRFVADRAKSVAVFGIGALALVHLALIALVIGLIIALIPLVGPWLATGIVVLALLVGAAVLGFILKGKLADIGTAMSDGDADSGSNGS